MAGSLGKMEIGLVVTTAISLGSWIFSAGILYGQIQSNTKEISVVQTSVSIASAKNNSIDNRLARIETKVDLLIDDRIKR
jgi:hypothetical protein